MAAEAPSAGAATGHHAQSYFRLLLERARSAGATGNYAIAAALVVRAAEWEVVVLGANTVFAGHDPAGHAEMNAIGRARQAAGSGPAGELQEWLREGLVMVRPAPHAGQESILYTTLEPCPMCSVCIITAGVRRVVIAAADPPSGTLAPQRLAALPPIWAELAGATGLRVDFCQSEDPGDPGTYLPDELRGELLRTFLDSRQQLDERLAAGGILDLAGVWRQAVASARGASPG